MKKIVIVIAAVALVLSACVRAGENPEAGTASGKPMQTETVQTETPAEPNETTPPETDMRSLDWDAKESYILEKIAMAEAEGEDTKGKALVMLVVLNRVWADSFPDTVEEVVMQENQFSPVANGRYDSVEPDADCQAALELVESGWDGSQGALYFESRSDSTWHQEHLTYLFRHGNHYFYKEKEGV